MKCLAGLLGILLLFSLLGCGQQKIAQAPAESLSYDDALLRVQTAFPASDYVLDQLVVEANNLPAQYDGPPVSLRVGMPWILNDQEAPFYLAQELGYFEAQGLEVELVPGGPSVDPLVLLAGGQVDIAVPATSLRFVRFIASETGADLVVFAANLAHAPSVWIGLDPDTPSHLRSNRELVPRDLIGKTIGVQRGYEYLPRLIENRNGLPPDSIKTVFSGSDAGPMVAGAIDLYAGWIMNQPRMLEEQGHMNWIVFKQAKYGIDAYCDVSVSTRSFAETQPNVLRRYVKALSQAHAFLFANPDESAEITKRYAIHSDLSEELIKRRFELQRSYISPADGSPVLSVSAERFNTIAASLLQFDQISIESPEEEVSK